MAPGDLLLGAVVGLLDGAVFGLLAVLVVFGIGDYSRLGFVEAAANLHAAGTLFLALGVVWLPLSALSYYRFRQEQEWFPVLRRFLSLYDRVSPFP